MKIQLQLIKQEEYKGQGSQQLLMRMVQVQ